MKSWFILSVLINYVQLIPILNDFTTGKNRIKKIDLLHAPGIKYFLLSGVYTLKIFLNT